jgi:hypothetical protein
MHTTVQHLQLYDCLQCLDQGLAGTLSAASETAGGMQGRVMEASRLPRRAAEASQQPTAPNLPTALLLPAAAAVGPADRCPQRALLAHVPAALVCRQG